MRGNRNSLKSYKKELCYPLSEKLILVFWPVPLILMLVLWPVPFPFEFWQKQSFSLVHEVCSEDLKYQILSYYHSRVIFLAELRCSSKFYALLWLHHYSLTPWENVTRYFSGNKQKNLFLLNQGTNRNWTLAVPWHLNSRWKSEE